VNVTKVLVHQHTVSYWDLVNLSAQESYREQGGLMLIEALRHEHVTKAKTLTTNVTIEETFNDQSSKKTISVYAYFDADALVEWEQYLFMDRLST